MTFLASFIARYNTHSRARANTRVPILAHLLLGIYARRAAPYALVHHERACLVVPRMLREARETLLWGESRGMRPRLSIRIYARMLFRENNKVTGNDMQIRQEMLHGVELLIPYQWLSDSLCGIFFI